MENAICCNFFWNINFKCGDITFRVNWIKPFFHCISLSWESIELIVTLVFPLITPLPPPQVFPQEYSTYCIPVYGLHQVMNSNCLKVLLFLISVYCLCITWYICVALTSSWQLEGLWPRETASVYGQRAHTHSRVTDMHVGGWCVLSWLCCREELGPSAISNQSSCTWTTFACVWTNCVWGWFVGVEYC